MSIDLQRFLDAQAYDYQGYATALAEMKAGRKASHWIWYIFPTVADWAHSSNHIKYGIHGREEAEAYLRHPILGARLREITNVILSYRDDADPDEFMMWDVDARKLLACMTLFDYISPNDIFAEVCRKYFQNRRSRTTLEILNNTSKS